MQLMSHFDKTVINIAHKKPRVHNRHMGQESKYFGNLKTIKCHVTSSKQIFAIYPCLNRKFSILKYLDNVQSPEDYKGRSLQTQNSKSY